MGVTEIRITMKPMNNIKIDQIRLNIPYEYVSKIDLINSKYPKEVILIDRIFHFARLFRQSSEGHGHNGYTNSYNFGSGEQGGTVSIMWNGTREDMGILVDLTATGKVLFEDLAEMQGITIDWKEIIQTIYKEYRGHISRIDIATDLLNYGFSVNEISQRLKNQESFFINKQGNRISSNRFKIVGTTDAAQTLYIGSRKSDAFLRIYDKKIEQNRTDGLYRSLAKECEDWVRIEGEFKHRLAKEIGTYISNIETDSIYPYLLGCVLERWSLVDINQEE